MKEKVEFLINEEINKKFKIALMLSGEDESELIEEWMEKYIQKTFAKEAGLEVKHEVSENKTINKIYKWVNKDNVPHKIIKAFLLNYNVANCSSNKDAMLESYIAMGGDEKKFKDNYSQMKSAGAHAHGVIFYDEGRNVYLDDQVKEIILKLKNDFLN